jgi:deoxyribonuclease (pyrimidine dimer)
MTRINCIDPAMLSGKHLVAEYRELPRVFGLAHAAMLRGEQPDAPRFPSRYTMGRGHVLFFYPRCGYLRSRFLLLVAEMQRRGYSPAYPDVPPVFQYLDKAWRGTWTPDAPAVRVNVVRLLNKDPAWYGPAVHRVLAQWP